MDKQKVSSSRWKILIGIPILVILILSLLLVGLRPECFTAYPGRFVYQETRYVDNPAEAAALEVVETFNYTLIPTNCCMWSTYINQTRLTQIANQALTFNPFLYCGSDVYNYTAQVTYQNAVNISLNPVSDQYYFWHDPSYNITTGTTLLYPNNDWDQCIWEWAAGFKNNSTYQNIQIPLNLTYTNVYLVDIEFWYSYHHSLLAAGTELEQQQAIINETGTLLFVFWSKGNVGPIA
ncbi:MAG: hypothetical protein ACFFCF_12160 [Promethearchaeota archaeon]